MIEQTIRIWSLPSGECKSELRGHDNVIECIAWAPDSAGSYISESVSNGVTDMVSFHEIFFLVIVFIFLRHKNVPVLILYPVHVIRQFECGM